MFPWGTIVLPGKLMCVPDEQHAENLPDNSLCISSLEGKRNLP